MVPSPCRGPRAALLIALLAAASPARSQQLPLQEFSSRDGLGSDFVSYVVEDSHGYVWFCTRDGLSRYDGSGFVTYGTAAGLPSTTVRFVLEAHDGAYWIATDAGVVRFDPGACAEPAGGGRGARDCGSLFRTLDPGAPGAYSIHEDRAGTIWAGGPLGLYRLDPARQDHGFVRVDLGLDAAGSALVSEIVGAGEDGLWISTPTRLVRRFRDGNSVSFDFGNPHGKQASTLLLAGDTVWLGTGVGLFALRPRPNEELRSMRDGSIDDIGEVRRYTTANGLPHDTIDDLDATADGRLWVATQNGVVSLEASGFQSYASPDGGMATLRAWALATDGEGNLWLAGSGLCRFRIDGFVTYDDRAGLGDPFVRAIFEDARGTIHVVTKAWELCRLGEDGFESAVPRLALGPSGAPWMSQAGFLDSRGHWWVLAEEGLYRFGANLEPSQLSRARPDLVLLRGRELDGSPVRMYEDARGDIWIGTRRGGTRGGLLRWDVASGTLRVYSTADGLPHDKEPRSFAEDAAGRLWIGFSTGGLVRLRDGRFESFEASDGVPEGGVPDLHADAAGRLWVATTVGGLGRIDAPTADRPSIRRHTTADGLASNNVRCLTEDRLGQIYVGTVRGVDRLDPESGRVRHYTRDDGLAGDFTTSAHRDRRGQLWFGTTRGVSSLWPRADRTPPQRPARIGSLRISGETYRLSEIGTREIPTLTLAPSQNRIEIEFHAAASGVRYQYKLEGSGDHWSVPTTSRAVDFSSLSPGRYRFLVRAIAADGTVDEVPASFSFAILPPIWQRAWIQALAAAVLGLGVYATFRARLNRQLELERVRTQIAADLHDDIGAGLSQVAIVSEVVRRQVGPDAGAAGERLEEIAEVSRGLVDSMSDIVWAINPQRDSVHDVVQRMRRVASDTLSARGIELRFSAPVSDGAAPLGPGLRREVYLVFKEALHNVVKHAHCRSVDVEIDVKPTAFHFAVRDDGLGFDPSGPRDGHGLASMARRAERLGGSLSVERGPGEGTVVRLAVPLRRHSSGWVRRITRRRA